MTTRYQLETAWPLADNVGCSTLKQYLDWASELRKCAGVPSFRGVDRCFGNLRASIDRQRIDADAIAVETGLLSEFMTRAWEHLTPQERFRYRLAEIRWGSRNTGAMVVARHRLVPTRCVDWTNSCLHALLLACSESHQEDGEVWWFDREQFNRCVGAQWPSLYRKFGHVEDDLEQDFIDGKDATWFTAFGYMQLQDDRLDRQEAWTTVAGRLRTCHAEEIHRIGLRSKGRLRILAKMKLEALRELNELGITKDSLGLVCDHADEIAQEIRDEFRRQHPHTWNKRG